MKRLLFLFGFVIATTSVSAQSVWGETEADSVKCYEQFNIFGSLYKEKNYVEAYDAWNHVYNNCAGVKSVVFIWGPRIVESKIKVTTDEAEKAALVEQLISIYDKRLEYFPGKEGYVKAEKASKYYKYNKDSIDRAAAYFEEAYAIDSKMTAAQLNGYFMASIKQFNVTKDAEALFVIYDKVTESISAQVEELNKNIVKWEAQGDAISKKDAKYLKRAPTSIRQFEKVLSNVEIALRPLLSCDNLNIIYSEARFEEKKDDVKWLKSAANRFQKSKVNEEGEKVNCMDNPMFFTVIERLYELEPSAQSARSMATLSMQKEDYQAALTYMESAIAQDTNVEKQAVDYLTMANINHKIGNNSAAKANCIKAGQLKKNWGAPYLLLATFYADYAGKCGSNAVEKNAVYWAAIDMCVFARSIDSESASQANKLIAAYKPGVPDKTVAFQLGYVEGDPINIGCWINEKVTVKFY